MVEESLFILYGAYLISKVGAFNITYYRCYRKELVSLWLYL